MQSSLLMRRSRAVVLACLLAAGCASNQPKAMVAISPGVGFALPGPGGLGAQVRASQHIVAHYGDQIVAFETRIEAEPNKLLLSGQDAYGRHALTVTWTNAGWDENGVTFDAAEFLPEVIRPANLLADIVLAYAPANMVRQGLAGSGTVVEESATERSIQAGGREIIHINYEPDRAHAWNGRVHYKNIGQAYDMDIVSTVTGP